MVSKVVLAQHSVRDLVRLGGEIVALLHNIHTALCQSDQTLWTMSCCRNEHWSPPAVILFIHVSFINHIETPISCAANFQCHHLLTSSYMGFLLIRAFTIIYIYVLFCFLLTMMHCLLEHFSCLVWNFHTSNKLCKCSLGSEHRPLLLDWAEFTSVVPARIWMIFYTSPKEPDSTRVCLRWTIDSKYNSKWFLI